jgi:hypothetical protein
MIWIFTEKARAEMVERRTDNQRSMSALNRIEAQHIERLKPHELVMLLQILLYAEAKQRRANASIHVPLQINVPDDGEDARWTGDLLTDEFIPDKFTVYQSKAEDLAPGDCESAVVDRSHLKKAVDEVLAEKGCYVFFCGHGYVQKLITRRIRAAVDAIIAAGRQLTRKDQIRFLDGNMIAAWTNRHASAIAHVCECCQLRQNVSFRTWKDWKRDPVCVSPVVFQSNEQLQRFMASARQHLLVPGNIARITGLSGLGKTRLASEALSPPRDLRDVAQASLSDTAVYLNMEYAPVAVLDMISQFEAAGLSGTVVVDNCPREQHIDLEQILRRDGCKLSLLTLDYVPEATRPGILHIQLTPEMMREIVLGILKQFPQARHLTESQLNHIASFAHGFPQIAALMAEAGDALDLAGLDQHRIAQRILWGRDAPNERAKEVLCALSLFAHVGFEGDPKAQKEFVRTELCATLRLSERDFDRLLQPFFERRILQRAGDYIMVTPPPLAVALAADWWGLARADELARLIPRIEVCGMTKFFCNRVQQLHFSPNAQALAAQLCGDTGPLCDAEVLNTELGSELFRALVELNPVATMDCLWRLFNTKGRDELLRFNVGRRNLIWALEKLCWSKQNFIRGATLLLNFATAENEGWANNATAQFKQLFQLYLGGTQMPGVERLPVVEAGLASDCEHRRAICIQALGTALQGGHFSRMGGVEVRGSGLPEKDWEPQTNRDIAEYWLKSVHLLKTVILQRKPDAALAKKVLGEHLRTVLIPPLLDKIETDFREVAAAEQHFWLEAIRSIQDHLEHSVEQTPESRQKLAEWLELLTPRDFSLRLQLAVSNARFQHRKKPDGTYLDVAAETAEKLADEVIQQKIELTPFLAQLLQGNQAQAFPFGQRLGEKLSSSEHLIAQSLTVLRAIDSERRNPMLLAGVLHGVKKPELIKRTLTIVANDDHLVDLLVRLMRTTMFEREDLERVVQLISEGKIPPDHLRQFAFGSVLDHTDAHALTQLFAALVKALPEARLHVFEALFMYIYQSDERWRKCRDLIRNIVLSPGFASALVQTMDGYYWQQAVSKLLTENRDEELAIEVTKQIIEVQTRRDARFIGDTYQRAVLRVLLSQYSFQIWPLLGAELLSKSYYKLKSVLGGFGFNDKEFSVLWEVPNELMLAWVNENPRALPRILNTIALFTVDENEEYHWHPLVLGILNRDLDREAIGAIWSNLFSYSSTGSRVPYIEKRVRLLRELDRHSNPTVQEMGQMLIAAFEKDKERCLKEDEEFSAGIL